MNRGRRVLRKKMKITTIKTRCLRTKLSQPFAFSQWKYDHRETALVCVRTDEGIEGWGEVYGPAKPAAAIIEEFLAPLAIGRDPRDTEALWHLLYTRSLYYGQKGIMLAAISALDIAFWDIKARAAGVPLYRLLGGEETQSIPCYATGFYFGGEESLEKKFQREAEEYLRRGFRAMKVKVGLGVERDAKLVEVVRKVIGPDVRLMIDANHAYTPAEAVALGRRVEPFDIYWFEEPVSPLGLDGYCEVKRQLAIPIAGGEAEYTRFGFEPLLRRRAVDFAQPDLCACGGITEGMKIATLASVYDVHLTPHVWGTAIGQAAALHFYAARPRHPGTLTPEDKLIECDQTESPFRSAIVIEAMQVKQGQWSVPQRPGLGLEINPEGLERFAAN